MSVTLTFYKISEKKPNHGETIIWLEGISSFDAAGFMPREVTAEYNWIGIDLDGEDDGEIIAYNGETEMVECRLGILFNEYEAEDDFLWMPVDDYWKAFGLGD